MVLDGVAEVLARATEGFVGEGLNVFDRLALPEARHERPVTAGKELEDACAGGCTLAALQTLASDGCGRRIDELVLDDDEHDLSFRHV